MAMSHQFGFFIGPPLGGLIIDWVHWRGIFFLLFVPSLIGMILCLVTGRSAARPAGRPQAVDFTGAILFFALSIMATLLLDQKIAALLNLASQAALVGGFAGILWGFIAHERKTAAPVINLGFFAVTTYGYGALGLLMCCITQGLVTFIAPFYLQDVLKLSPSFIGVIFLAPSLLSMVLSPVSGALTDRIGARSLLLTGIVILMVAFAIGARLRPDSHWLWPALLLGLVGIGSAFFNTPSQAVMIGSLPKDQWGSAIGIINGIFGLGHMLGISLSGIFLTLAFRYYSGVPGTTPDPGDTTMFVAAMNATFLFALAISAVPLATSLKMKKVSQY